MGAGVRPANSSGMASGAEGSRTLDLLNAIQALSQLSYGPTRRELRAEAYLYTSRAAEHKKARGQSLRYFAGLTGAFPSRTS